ncbi:unnamed protein product [Rotaria sordida]|uniref:Macro domain-containing protein n=1 Tax=Rotaria sordida TaxID=392033 RepID=A0A819HD50_9BILA|nr:unnamed protein product [Rotaria sordida]CAF3969498.1 unnamed protein product [Rotaria sordida]CAF4021823.1 unnamed protein product [Rotaria sordida]
MVTTIQRKQFIIDDIRFSSLAVVEEKHLVEIGLAHKCLSKTEFESTEKIYSAPIPSFDRSANGFTPSAMSIDIRTGDLAEQSVDTVVVCSTSQYLLNDILDKAGTSIKNQVIEALQNGQITYNGYETSGGQLFCQRLLFVPWTTQKLDDRNLRQSIHIFFTTAIIHALNTQQTSIAFPALGCGELKYDPKLIAEHVIPEVNSTNEKLQLAGPKDKVMDTKTEFYRMKSRKAEESRIASYARIAIWVYETTTGTIEKYSLKLNALIEEAFSNNRDSVRTVTMSFST